MEALLKNPAYHDLLSIIKGFRNGAVYGAKIRFPHALVMTFLFRDGRYHLIIGSRSQFKHIQQL
jgi:peroxisomal membrane protein 4